MGPETPRPHEHGEERDSMETLVVAAQPTDAVDEHRAKESLKQRLFRSRRPADALTLARYILLDRIAAGGVGVVHSAYDPELDRKVAIKLLRAKRSGDSAGRARLVREAQAMAKLSHPNVLPVYDVGTYGDDDLAAIGGGVEQRGIFIVMELVAGVDLAGWLEQAERPWGEVVDAFISAGRGLAAAHAAGLVHRDFKPANVLVGNDGRVRVLDFGLARAAGDSIDSGASPELSGEASALDSDLTGTGWLLGTPAYMAPEQHERGPADARSDQFAFCLSLWEGLYGSRPYAAASERELAEAKLAGPPASPRDSAVPARLYATLARGLAPDPNERHANMDRLLAELGRRSHRGRWIAAGPVAVVAGGSLLTLDEDAGALTCREHTGMLDGVWDAEVRAKVRTAFLATHKPYAEEGWRSVEAGLDTYTSTWSEQRTQACEATLVREHSPERINRLVLCLDRRLHRVAELTAVFAEANGETVERAVAAVDALPSMTHCASGPGHDDGTLPEVVAHDDRVEELLASVSVRAHAGKYDEALEIAETAVDAARTAERPSDLGRALRALAGLHQDVGQRARAEDLFNQAIWAAERAGDDRTAAYALIDLANLVGPGIGRLDESERTLQLATAKIDREGLGEDAELRVELVRGRIRMEQGAFAEALTALEHALALARTTWGEDNLEIAQTLLSVGAAHEELGQLDEAQDHYERALALVIRKVGATHPTAAAVLNNLGNVATVRGSYTAGIEHYQQALAIAEGAWSPDHPNVASARNNLGNALARVGRDEDALASYEQALAAARATLGDEHAHTATYEQNRANTLNQLGRPAEAVQSGERAIAIFERVRGPDHPSLGYPLANLAQALQLVGRSDEALAAGRRAIDIWDATLGPDHANMALALKALGVVQISQDRLGTAAALLERALAIQERAGLEPIVMAETQLQLARALHRANRSRARALIEQARRHRDEAGDSDDALKALDTWLAEVDL